MNTYTKTQLAEEYGVAPKTLMKWLQPIADKLQCAGQGRRSRRLIAGNDLKKIREFLGEP